MDDGIAVPVQEIGRGHLIALAQVLMLKPDQHRAEAGAVQRQLPHNLHPGQCHKSAFEPWCGAATCAPNPGGALCRLIEICSTPRRLKMWRASEEVCEEACCARGAWRCMQQKPLHFG